MHTHTHTRACARACRTAVAAACQDSSVANRWIDDADETEGERECEIHLNHLPLCLESLPQQLKSFNAAA